MEEKATMEKITSFKELMNEIAYSWDWNYEFSFDEQENYFYLNKLCISPDRVSYKLENWELAPGVFEDVKAFYKLLNPSK
jgi:hypothetical protein